MLASVSAEAKYCIGSTPATTRLGYGVPPDGEVRELPEHDDVHRGGEDRARGVAQEMPRNVCL